MSTKIDWLSFSVPVRYSSPNDTAYTIAIESALSELLGQWLTDELFGAKWELQEHGRQPYKHVWKRKDSSMLMFTHPNLNHMTVELSGTAMDWLRGKDLEDVLLQKVCARVTRLDVATDIQTKTSPQRFVEAGVSSRFTGRGVFTSASGETVYIGSQKSDRFARVYRYAPPHPRSHLLRIEHVLRRDAAKVYARELSHTNVENVAGLLGQVFEWRHSDWSLHPQSVSPSQLSRGDRASSGTVRWLMTSAAPAFKRLVNSGEIPDAEQFLRSYFLGED